MAVATWSIRTKTYQTKSNPLFPCTLLHHCGSLFPEPWILRCRQILSYQLVEPHDWCHSQRFSHRHYCLAGLVHLALEIARRVRSPPSDLCRWCGCDANIQWHAMSAKRSTESNMDRCDSHSADTIEWLCPAIPSAHSPKSMSMAACTHRSVTWYSCASDLTWPSVLGVQWSMLCMNAATDPDAISPRPPCTPTVHSVNKMWTFSFDDESDEITFSYFSRSNARLNGLQHFYRDRRGSIFNLCFQCSFENKSKCTAPN